MGTLGLLRWLRRVIRQVGRTLVAAWGRWAEWAVQAAMFVAVLFVAPLFDVELIRAWRRDGWASAKREALVGVAVNVRLLFDRKVPTLARIPLAFALVYGVAAVDLLPDGLGVVGRVEDIIVTLVAARLFTALCPDSRVAAHVRRVARGGLRARPGSSGADGDLARM